jgi:multiple sugar transport system permease protein
MSRRGRDPSYTRAGYLFLLPNFTGFLLFILAPVVASLVLSFCSWHIFNDPSPRFVGFANFAKLLASPEFWYYTWNTVFLMLGIPVGMALSLALAMLLNKGIRAIRLYRMVYFLPTISSGVALLVLWLWIYNPSYGLMNYMLAKIGIEGPNWLAGGVQLPFLRDWFGIDATCYWSKLALMLMGLWGGVGGYNMILYLAGLQGINPELYEAAEVDGASAWQRFRYITWPMLAPTTFFILIMSLIDGFQGGFQAAYVMTAGGPEGSTTTISYHIFNELYQNHRAGYASAIAWLLFVVIFVLTLLSWRWGGKVVHYE